jgi:hypothetical protein
MVRKFESLKAGLESCRQSASEAHSPIDETDIMIFEMDHLTMMAQLARRCHCYSLWIVSIIVLSWTENESFAWNVPTTNNNNNRHHQFQSFSSCRELVADFVTSDDFIQQTALQRTVLWVPSDCIHPNVIYRQLATQSTCQGIHHLEQATREWWRESSSPRQNDYDDDDLQEWQLQSNIVQISSLSPTIVQINWNVTWIPPTAVVWHRFGTMIPGLLQVQYVTYNHRSGFISTFSWKTVATTLLDTIQNGQWKVPLACIQGMSRLEFKHEQEVPTSESSPASSVRKLCSITEDLVYAIDLQQGRLLNRKCAEDLRLFLEIGRRVPATTNNQGGFLREDKESDVWQKVVATCLPWSSVPGSGALDIEPMEEGERLTSAILFGASSVMILLGFATWLAPQVLQ